MSVFHGWLDGGNGLWGDLSFFRVFCASLRSAQNKFLCSRVVRAGARTYLKSNGNSKCEKQIPPLRCGMTTKRATAKASSTKKGNGKSKFNKKGNGKKQVQQKRQRQKQVHKKQATAKQVQQKQCDGESRC
jgi:hypothetical protein